MKLTSGLDMLWVLLHKLWARDGIEQLLILTPIKKPALDSKMKLQHRLSTSMNQTRTKLYLCLE